MVNSKYYDLYLAIGPQRTINGKNAVVTLSRRWSLLLRDSQTNTWECYTCDGGPYSNGPATHRPYTKVEYHHLPPGDPHLGEERFLLCRIEERQYETFTNTALDQISWQTQYFVVGYLYGLARLGVVDWGIPNEWARKAQYTSAELGVLSPEMVATVAREIADVAREQPPSVYSSVVGYLTSYLKVR
ncbi:hypothetical protein BJX64DRAFT_290981 [Aspergillus heterothallicus]